MAPPSPPPRRGLPAWIGLWPAAVAAVLLILLRAPGVAWVVLGGAVMVVGILEVVAGATRSSNAGKPELQPVTEAGVALVRLAEVAVALLESGIAVAIGARAERAIALVVAAGLLLLVVAMVRGVRGLGAALEAVRAAGHGNLVKGYGPMVYRNKDDPRVWVPKLGGVGHTLNFAHGQSWAILAAFLVLPVGALVTVLLAFLFRK